MAYKAFVSSTFLDLQKHRKYIIETLRKAGFFVDPMEDWTATNDEPQVFSQARLDGCDLCILLVGFRRGYIPRGGSYSITQLEYMAARKRSIDVLAFLLQEDAPWPRQYDEFGKDAGIKTWREELRHQHGVGFFGLEPASIEISTALNRWLTEKGSRESIVSNDYDLLFELQPDLDELKRKCRPGNSEKVMQALREMISLRLNALAKREGRDETGNPPMEVLRRLEADGRINAETLKRLEHALTITSGILYNKEVDIQDARDAIGDAAVGLNFISESDPKQPRFRIVVSHSQRFLFAFCVDGKELVASELYGSKQGVLGGIRSFRYAAGSKPCIWDYGEQKGSYAFNVVGPNGEVLGRSIKFASGKARDRAREAVIQFAPHAPTVMPKE
jgi:hypothetical protein